jgi:ribonuclease BN (tRNA processing enzyme)
MKLHILGCGDAFGSGGRNQSGYLIEASDRLFLLDCGPTTLLALKRAGFDPSRLDAVLLSHLHGDHCAGLPFLFIEYLYQRPRQTPLQIAGPAGTEEKVRSLFDLMYGSVSMAKELPPVEFQLLEPDRNNRVAGIDVYAFRVPHQVTEISLGLKVRYEGKQILFSGDSAWTELFVRHARDADLFLCECSFYDSASTNHLRYSTLRERLPDLGCKQLVLTHLGEEMLARHGQVDVTLAYDGMVLTV